MRQFYGHLEFPAFFLQENLHVHKILRFRGGVFWVWGGGSADFIFMGAGIFLRNRPLIKTTPLWRPRIEKIKSREAILKNQAFNTE